MRILVLTGMSGSGKSTAIHALEDVGYYTIDNLPIKLMDKLVELFSTAHGEIEKVALVVDARATNVPRDSRTLRPPAISCSSPRALDLNRLAGHEVDLVFLDARTTCWSAATPRRAGAIHSRPRVR